MVPPRLSVPVRCLGSMFGQTVVSGAEPLPEPEQSARSALSRDSFSAEEAISKAPPKPRRSPHDLHHGHCAGRELVAATAGN
ncbi:MAG: hypothetical protein M9932_18495 [Xanthobacteraceae bacterium]|nr:hypothetical protein [Xanthobacteraceae bacterium]